MKLDHQFYSNITLLLLFLRLPLFSVSVVLSFLAVDRNSAIFDFLFRILCCHLCRLLGLAGLLLSLQSPPLFFRCLASSFISLLLILQASLD